MWVSINIKADEGFGELLQFPICWIEYLRDQISRHAELSSCAAVGAHSVRDWHDAGMSRWPRASGRSGESQSLTVHSQCV